MQNLSDKLGDFNLGSSMTSSPVEAGPGGSWVGGKRSSREAENDSASMLIPRQMERQQSSIQTPNVSSNLSEILQNCKQINDLWEDNDLLETDDLSKCNFGIEIMWYWNKFRP